MCVDCPLWQPVGRWLAGRGLGSYAEAFGAHGYHGSTCALVLEGLP
jgi:hypothetical protein